MKSTEKIAEKNKKRYERWQWTCIEKGERKEKSKYIKSIENILFTIDCEIKSYNIEIQEIEKEIKSLEKEVKKTKKELKEIPDNNTLENLKRIGTRKDLIRLDNLIIDNIIEEKNEYEKNLEDIREAIANLINIFKG